MSWYAVPTGSTGSPVELYADSYDAAVRLWARLQEGPATRGEPVEVGNPQPVFAAFADLAGPYLSADDFTPYPEEPAPFLAEVTEAER